MTEHAQALKIDARAEAQRRRILLAAQKCFVERGFHAASMAVIAETAEMSAGLIYRYFKSKSEIILAIIERQLEATLEKIGQMHGSTAADMAASIIQSLCHHGDCDEHSMSGALFLEMSAEATRDPQIAAALAAFDAAVHAEVGHWLGRSREEGGFGLPQHTVPARALMFVCLIEGLRVRETRDPAMDRTMLRSALSEILPALLEPCARADD